jgi:protein tyrosine phosphatase
MSNDLADYINTSMVHTPSPKRKSLGKPIRIKRAKILGRSNSRESLSPETRNIAILLSKHKMEEEVAFQPAIVKDPEFYKDDQHKLICNCKISEVDFKKMVSVQIGEYKLFISCKYAASDLTELIEKKIMAILSVGELPKCYPMIKGGYFHLDFSGVAIFNALQQATRFLNAKLRTGNVLVHCEDGNKKSVILIIAYLLKETRLTFRAVSDLMKKCRPHYSLSQDQELYLRKFDKN